VPDPVSWKVIERGWRVVGADEVEVGSVHEVIGDAGVDIFNGLAVSPGRFKASRYIPAEHVGEIVEGEVRLATPASAFGSYEEWRGTPPHERVESHTTDL
jgi:hypothetical protein